jgi:SPP1 gp7 family putative phage head morphogenesis protein
MTANEQLRDKTIAHEILLAQLTTYKTNKIMRLLADVDKDLIAKLKSLDIESTYSIKRIDDQLKSIRTIMDKYKATLTEQIDIVSKDVATYEQEWQIKTINGAVPIALDVISVAPATLYQAIDSKLLQGKQVKEWIGKLDKDSFDRIQTAVRMGLVEGETYAQVTKRITGTKALQYSDGILSLNNKQTNALVSTTIAHATNTARDELYKANSDIIKGLQWVSTLDMRTSSICRGRDGQVFPLNSGARPPAHFRCRSAMVAILKSWKELGLKDPTPGTRASMSGQVAETETYQTWLAKKSHEFQDEVLGKAKADIFRSGVTLDRFVVNGKELTLEQLKKIEK